MQRALLHKDRSRQLYYTVAVAATVVATVAWDSTRDKNSGRQECKREESGGEWFFCDCD